MDITIYDTDIYVDVSMYTTGELGTNDGFFNQEFRVLVPNDAFNGFYPEDWLVWATHVKAANNYITEKFEEFYNLASELNNDLCIGYTQMCNVPKHALVMD